MSVAFRVEVTPSRRAARLAAACRAVPIAGLSLAALRFAEGPTLMLDAGPAAGLAASAACLATAAWLAVGGVAALRRAGRPPDGPAARLEVDADGEVRWCASADATASRMVLHGWWGLPGLTWLVLTQYPRTSGSARPIVLVLGRDAVPEAAWRRLNVWLRWLDRGPPGSRPSGPDPT
ncbi:MAG TPA: protein YgfX [Burkholderiaceae bacterium]|nr:protein YgfX [Burkholderiaceae bacterium]